jgi:ABC-type multidrug transport system ATPase subunit
MDQAAVRVERFSKRYGTHMAVEDLSFEVPRGSLFALLGRNGAGKTTTLRALLGLLRPTSGRLSVLGVEPGSGAVALRRRVGFLPEEPGTYPWMTVREIVRFNAAFYPAWDDALAGRLLRELDLPPERRLRDLSRGMRTKVGLLLAVAFRPELLVLDDPTAGLDPVVRREFLEAVIGNVHTEGGTVLFSTHLLQEMERVADEVAIIHGGRLRLRGALDDLKAGFRRLRAVWEGDPPASFDLPGLLSVERDRHQALLTFDRFEPSHVEALRRSGATSVEVMEMALEEIFFAVIRDDACGRPAGAASASAVEVAHA